MPPEEMSIELKMGCQVASDSATVGVTNSATRCQSKCKLFSENGENRGFPPGIFRLAKVSHVPEVREKVFVLGSIRFISIGTRIARLTNSTGQTL